jgi:tryptophan synthase alpha chain
MPFVVGGYPSIEATAATLAAVGGAGASLIEVGFPFSDPIADGPTIQAAYTETLSRNVHTRDVFAMVKSARRDISVPLVGMVSHSIVYRYGLDAFAKDAKASGFDALLIPDLPPPEIQSVCETIRGAGLDTVLMVAPTTSRKRREQIAKLTSGFIYLMSVSGITGERDKLPEDVERNINDLKSLSDLPVCVGFGIHRAEQVKQLLGMADGAIVGTALVRKMKENATQSPNAVAAIAASYCRELLSKV